ncbi:MAG TPA: tetraacyldisaccharide 4'-kinase [Rhizobiales bacterium]|nr:tetraacyldisaccharide 4'-kinase [Hyphomicrobiales bacterium]
MASEAPPFWWTAPDWRAYALLPLSAVYGAVAARRMVSAARQKVDLPVLCVGNLTVGGTGKTPVAIALARQALAMKLVPGFLSRGHGGGFSHPHIVDPRGDSARHVGDEPLLLAEHAPVAVTANRAAGAKILTERGCDFLIMDDGFQSARIHIDFALLVVDAMRGIGNGHVIPGGPLRAPVVGQLRFADAIVKMGDGDAADGVIRMAARANRPVFEARARPRNPETVAGRRVLAFSGIGNPQKFYRSLQESGAELVATRSFPDHHQFMADELGELAIQADKAGLDLVTTAKDAVRLRHAKGVPEGFAERLRVLEIDAVFETDPVPERIIADTLAAWRKRQLDL